MFDDWTVVYILAVLFLATLIRSTFGFGDALVAMPLLALVIPVDTAAPLVILLSITIAGVVLAQDWRNVHVRSAGWLVFSTLFGIPLGLWLLWAADEALVESLLGILIIGFSLYCLIRKMPYELKDDRYACVFGFIAGILGGAYGMNGPPLVIYGALRRWTPEQFRATLQGYFLPASAFILFGFWLTGKWTLDVTYYYLMALPAILVAVLLGRAIHQRLKEQRFVVFLYVGLILVGLALLARPLLSLVVSL